MTGTTTGGGAPTGLRERKKRETREALSWAALRLTIERGWENVTPDDIAAAANVSVRTFRNYFSSKAEAVVSRHLDRMARLAAALRARPHDEPLGDAVRHAVEAEIASWTESGHEPRSRQWADGVRLMLTEPDVQGEFLKAHAVAQEDLARAIAERTGIDMDRDVYPRLVAAVVGAAITAAMEHWLRADPPVPMRLLLRDVLDRLWAGLPVP